MRLAIGRAMTRAMTRAMSLRSASKVLSWSSSAALAATVALGCSSDPNALGDGADGTGTSGADSAASTGTASGDCVATINAYRAKVGQPALARWSDQEACASNEARSDSSSSKAHGAFGSCQEMAQNECPGWPGPAGEMIKGCLKAMWAEGPGGGHYENMRGKYTKVACGFHALPNGDVWAVQNFR